MINVRLTFPPKELNPNKRLHFAKLAKFKRQYRETCCVLTQNELRGKTRIKKPCVHLAFYPPDKRRRDWDNLLAAMKSGLDGVSDALGVDDSEFRISFEIMPERGDYVQLTITEHTK